LCQTDSFGREWLGHQGLQGRICHVDACPSFSRNNFNHSTEDIDRVAQAVLGCYVNGSSANPFGELGIADVTGKDMSVYLGFDQSIADAVICV
jgi:hypothetical protein